MKYFIKQRVFSWRDRFNIYDEYGNPMFYVEGQILSIGKKLRLYDNHGNELAFIHQKVLSLLPKYYLNRNNRDIAEVVKELSLLRPRYSVRGLGWTVSGNFLAHDYTIASHASPIATISKRWISWGDAYEIDIAPGIDPINILCIVLVIDAVLEAQQESASISND